MAQCPKCGTQLAPERLECAGCGSDVSLWLGRAGEVYGPYTLADLQQVRAERRLGAGDRVMMGSSGEWRPLSAVAGELFGKPLPPPPPQVYAPPQPKRRDNMQTLVVVLVVLFAGLPVLAILAAIVFPVFAKSRDRARQTACLSNMKQLSLGLLMYCQDNDERFPVHHPTGSGAVPLGSAGPNPLSGSTVAYSPGDWRLAIYPYIRNSQIFLCPSTRAPDGYRYSDRLYGVQLREIARPAETLSLYEKGFLDDSSPPPHNGGYNVGFTDGHCRWLRDSQGIRIDP